MKLRVEVTAEDIARGKRHECHSCPVALAMDRAGYPCAVLGEFIVVRREEVDVPDHVQDWISRFDQGEDVRPIAFDLDIPAPSPSPVLDPEEGTP